MKRTILLALVLLCAVALFACHPAVEVDTGHTVTYVCTRPGEDEWVYTDHVEDGGRAVAESLPPTVWYELSGWRLNGQPYDFATPVTQDITLHAVWVTRPLTILFYFDGVPIVEGSPYYYGDLIEDPYAQDPNRFLGSEETGWSGVEGWKEKLAAGYRFVGWTADGENLWNFETDTVADALRFDAVFEMVEEAST